MADAGAVLVTHSIVGMAVAAALLVPIGYCGNKFRLYGRAQKDEVKPPEPAVKILDWSDPRFWRTDTGED